MASTAYPPIYQKNPISGICSDERSCRSDASTVRIDNRRPLTREVRREFLLLPWANQCFSASVGTRVLQ